MSNPPKVTKTIASPVTVEVVPSSDVENQAGIPTATEVRSPYRPLTINSVIGQAAPAPDTSQRATPALSEREKILMEGYRTSRIVRYA